MARGRMLNKTISLDPEVAELVNEVGPLGGLLYTWIIAHLDRDGRISGNPKVLNAQVTPLIVGVTPDLVRHMLAKAHQLKLVEVYEADNKIWVSFPKFKQNQQGMRYDREASGLTPTPSGLTPEWIRQLPAEVNIKESNLTKEKLIKPSVGLIKTKPTVCVLNPDILKVFAHYRIYHPKAHPKPKNTSKEWKIILARLKDGYTTEDLKLAIDGCHRSAWHQGENERGKKYDTLELIMRDSSHVTKFIEESSKMEPVLSERERRGVRAGQQWLARHKEKDNG